MRLSLLLLASSLLFGCATTEYIEVPVPVEIPIKRPPQPASLFDVTFDVVTQENLDTYITENEERNTGLVFIALDIVSYEKLALNFAELRRYILDQAAIIEYYESQVRPEIADETTDRTD